MHTDIGNYWALVISVAALAGWWLCVRPRSSYRGAGTTMSVMIVLMAVLMGILAVRQPPRGAMAAPTPVTSLQY
ncbi:MAG: hypothetical protein ACKVS9_06625 [Phycisphaerae bacterium]